MNSTINDIVIKYQVKIPWLYDAGYRTIPLLYGATLHPISTIAAFGLGTVSAIENYQAECRIDEIIEKIAANKPK
jgi:hypothetical protein